MVRTGLTEAAGGLLPAIRAHGELLGEQRSEDLRLLRAEAVRAATATGAKALRRKDIGRIAHGMRADLIVLDAPSYVHLAYRPGVPIVAQVWQRGRRVV